MELGKAVLKRNGINTLSHAVHPKYGLAWTDGKDIFLVPVKHVIKGNSEPDKQIRLGSFQCVTYVSWSPVFISPSYLSVVHNDTVSLWLIDGTSTSLTSKQLRKISVTPIPQGCLWNPCCHILCVLTSKQVNFYCNHQQNKGSFAVSLPPDLQGEHISAGCWHDSGCKLFVAVQSSLVVYTWKDITNVAEFTSQVCSIPGLDGDICRIVSTLNGQLVVSVEMPIFDLLDDDMFENTAIADVAKLESDDEDESDDDSAEKTDEDRHNNNNVAEAAEDEVEDDDLVLRPCHQTDPGTHTQKLLNLELKSQHKMNHLSKLVQLNTEPDIITVAVAGIPYIMVPDLLHYHDATGTIIVGSNSNTQVYLYKAASMNKVNDIILKDNQRLKGIGTFTWPSKSVSIVGMMIGKVDIHDSAFPSSGSDKEYDLELQVFNNTNMEVMRPKANSVPALILNDTTHSDLSKKKHKDRNSSKLKDLKRPKTTKDSRESSHFDKLFRPFFGRSTMKGTKIIEVSRKNDEDAELELETINFSDQPAHFTVITSNQEAPQESKNSSFKLALSESHTKMASSGGLPAADVNPRNELTSRSNSLPNIIDEASAQEVKKNAEDKKSDTLERYIIEGAQKTQKPKKKKMKTHKKDKNAVSLINISYTEELVDDPVSLVTVSDTTSPAALTSHVAKVTNLTDDKDEDVTNVVVDSKTSSGEDSVETGDKIASSGDERIKDVLSSSQHTDLPIPGTRTKADDVNMSLPAQDAAIELENNVALAIAEDNISMETKDRLEDECGGEINIEFMKELCDLEAAVNKQAEDLQIFNRKIDRLTIFVDDLDVVSPISYCTPDCYDCIHVVRKMEKSSLKKLFLLDNGRLKYDTVLNTFDMETLEIIIGDVPIVVGCNIDGYIPMKFEPGSTVYIQGDS